MLTRIFLHHPHSIGEGYFQHLRTALGYSARLIAAGCACVVHAFLPSLFEKTGSKEIARLHDEIAARQNVQTQLH